MQALRFLRENEPKTGEWLPFPEPDPNGAPRLDLSWMSEAWWRLVTEQRNRDEPPGRLNRRHFEVCVFSQLLQELKSGDLCLPGSDHFADYRDQLISWEEYQRDVGAYAEMVGLSVDADDFVAQSKARLTRSKVQDGGCVNVSQDTFPVDAGHSASGCPGNGWPWSR